MDQNQIFKQLAEFNKISFNNVFEAMVLVQDQSERMTSAVLDQTDWLPAGSRNAIDFWVDSFKTGRQNFKKQVNEGYEQFEKLFLS